MIWLWISLAFLMIVVKLYYPPLAPIVTILFFFLLSLYQAYILGGPTAAIVLFFLLLIAIPIVLKVVFATIRKSSKKNTFFLSKDQTGFHGIETENSLLGKHGVADSDLKPSGYIIVDGKRVPAHCQGRYVEKGEKVVVIDTRGGYVIIHPETGEKNV